MRGRQSPVEALITLPRVQDESERRARWRQAIAALSEAGHADGPPPLDGVLTVDLLAAIRTALSTGLVDDLDWVAPGTAAVALFELMAALPNGHERRELGRRVFARLYRGTAGTFSAVATRMAMGTGRPLETATMRARVGLLFAMPVGSGVHSDPLALALVTRRSHFEAWVAKSSTGPLPARRLAATLIERATRAAAARASRGDPHAQEYLQSAAVKPVFDALLADREPLVWRHAAIARGLIAATDPRAREDIDLLLAPGLSPTEWRRAVVSLVACLASDFDTTMQQCKQLLEGEVAKRHPGIAATMLWGLPPVIEADPEAAEEFLNYICQSERHDVGVALVALLADTATPGFGTQASEWMRKQLVEQCQDSDPALQSLIYHTLSGLDRDHAADQGVVSGIRQALVAYETTGALQAYEIALQTATLAHASMDEIEALASAGDDGLPIVLPALADLDSAALERSRLYDLLLLGRRPGDSSASVPQMETLYDRISTWVIKSEDEYDDSKWSRSGATARQRRLIALLHLIDLETTQMDSGAKSDSPNAARVKERITRSIRVLLTRIADGPDATVHRVLCATLARSFDAAVREQVADACDLFLLVVHHLTDHHSIEAITEASTNLDVQRALQAYTEFLGKSSQDALESIASGTFDAAQIALQNKDVDAAALAQSVIGLSGGIGTNGSYRGEALRRVVLRLGRALGSIAGARGLSEVVEAGAGTLGAVTELENMVEAVNQLTAGATRRVLSESPEEGIDITADILPLSVLLERAVSSGSKPEKSDMAMAIGELGAALPNTLAAVVASVIARVDELPLQAAVDSEVIPMNNRRAPLPEWLLPRRTIGSFYVIRALGAGGASSVFIARRIEERNVSDAEIYALKVPYYDPNTARNISEQEFLNLFREEAGALLSLPRHPNLARFVNFDAEARPKPMLVMELIRGYAMDRVIRNRTMSTTQAFAYVEGVLAGLAAMHSAGVGHLDVKPSNVIVRDDDTPVLVDFGLSGRNLRPGCGTMEYTAPEILGVIPDGYTPTPPKTDLYAFAATAFELLTSRPLFDGGDELALISGHVTHDGWPPALRELATHEPFVGLCHDLASCLRRDPRDRPDTPVLQRQLHEHAALIQTYRWPIGAEPSTVENHA
ncbi:MAG: serine/threonine protein kinase [Polyangiaceae bacterium]|nr:serine/threonine protein kinase [Polyangiaceae bacterium]